MDMIGAVVAMNVTGHALARVALFVSVPVVRHGNGQLRMAQRFCLRSHIGIVPHRGVSHGQKGTGDHRDRDGQTEQDPDAAMRHDEMFLTNFLTKV